MNKVFGKCDHCKKMQCDKLYPYKDSQRKGHYCEECVEEFKSWNYKWDELEKCEIVH